MRWLCCFRKRHYYKIFTTSYEPDYYQVCNNCYEEFSVELKKISCDKNTGSIGYRDTKIHIDNFTALNCDKCTKLNMRNQ